MGDVPRPTAAGDQVLAAITARIRVLTGAARQAEHTARNDQHYAEAIRQQALGEALVGLHREITSREWLEQMWLVEPEAGDGGG